MAERALVCGVALALIGARLHGRAASAGRRPFAAPARTTTSASSATRWPSGCSTTAGSRRCCRRGSRSTSWSSATSASAATRSTTRLRSKNFGTPDEWLSGRGRRRSAATRTTGSTSTNTKADVIFAFFGYNESFAGEAGLDAFKKQLDDWIKHTLAQKYNGKTAPARRAVLADRARGPRQSRSAGRQGEQRSGWSSTRSAMARGRQGRTASRSSICSRRACKLYADEQGAAHDQRRPPERAKATGRSREVIDRALFGDPPAHQEALPDAAAPGGRRQGLLLVQPLPRDRRLLDLRRPRVPDVRPRQAAQRQRRAGGARRPRKTSCRPTTKCCSASCRSST